MSKNGITRRDFLKTAAAAPLAGAVLTLPTGIRAQTKKKVRVVLIRDEKSVIEYKRPDPDIVQAMLDRAVNTLFETANHVDAWKKIVQPSDIVGIKSNEYDYLPTTKEVEQAIKRRIMEAGVAEESIAIDDRGVKRNPVFQKSTALINTRPMRTHHWSGVGSLLKNYITFVPHLPKYHPDACADLGAIWNEFGLAEKTRLNILVMLFPLFHSAGPHNFNREYVWNYGGLIVGTDPVAVDMTGLRIIQAKRRDYFGEDKPLETPAKHIRYADERHKLGISDPERIEVIKLGWSDGMLI